MIRNIVTASSHEYGLGRLKQGEHQYMDRDYRFNYIPEKITDAVHIMTFGNDKLICEDEICFSFTALHDVDVFIIFADKFPVVPIWLDDFTRLRMNVTREDSSPETLKGFFSIFQKSFPKGKMELGGCSPKSMLTKDFSDSLGRGFCMYSVAVRNL